MAESQLRKDIAEVINRHSAESQLRKDIAEVINRHSAENGSDTPDFILAEYLESCLMSFNIACNRRSSWYQNSSESSSMEPEKVG